MNDLRFCYKISAEAAMAQDDVGNPAECYSQISLKCENLPEDYGATHKRFGIALAKQIEVKPEWVIPISEKEYDAETGEEDESDET